MATIFQCDRCGLVDGSSCAAYRVVLYKDDEDYGRAVEVCLTCKLSFEDWTKNAKNETMRPPFVPSE